MTRRIYYLLLVCSIAIASILVYSFKSKNNHPNDYQLSAPEKSYILPTELNEISGITILNDKEIACVQDELGMVYIYNLDSSNITKKYQTNLVGDYEGIALVENTIYLLRSDGVLVEYPDFKSPNLKIKEYDLNLPSSNNEGLCYDAKNDRLLIAAKIKAGKGKDKKETRNIYSFNLKTKKPNNSPILKLNIEDIEAEAIKKNIAIPYKINKKTGEKVNTFNFRPSEIAIHPINKHIYVLSSTDKLLLTINKEGEIKNLMALDPILFNKPEGLAFLPDGTMLISNEAKKEKPTLLTFKYQGVN
ncbi:hypothetical protein BH10BAC1_BH10BAC1_17320 [soil metagenome]